MEDVLHRAMFISSETNNDLILFRNTLNDTLEVYVFIEINHATANTPYHELIGKNITDQIIQLNMQSFDPNNFLLKLGKKLIERIRTAENSWLWIKAVKDV